MSGHKSSILTLQMDDYKIVSGSRDECIKVRVRCCTVRMSPYLYQSTRTCTCVCVCVCVERKWPHVSCFSQPRGVGYPDRPVHGHHTGEPGHRLVSCVQREPPDGRLEFASDLHVGLRGPGLGIDLLLFRREGGGVIRDRKCLGQAKGGVLENTCF